jgi:hypothetical protein
MAPWPRISATGRAPRVCAIAAPSAEERTSMSLGPPAAARMSKTGTAPASCRPRRE